MTVSERHLQALAADPDAVLHEPVYVDDDPTVQDFDEPAIGARPAAAKPGLKTYGLAELLSTSIEPPEMLAVGVPKVGLTVAAGPPKVGKTLFSSQLALGVSGFNRSDEPMAEFLGHPAATGPVLMILEEGSLAGIAWRIRRQMEALGITGAGIEIAHRQRVRLDDVRSVRDLRARVEYLDPSLVIVDPLNRLHGADENRPTQMTPVMDALAGIAYDFETAVLAIHHLAKPSQERRGTVWDRFRGASSIRSGTDANLILDGNGAAVQLVGEFRDAEPLSEYLELDRSTLTFRLVEAPAIAGKIDQAALEAFLGESDRVTIREVMARFDVKSKATAIRAIEALPGIDWFDGPRNQRFYTLGTVQ